MLALKHSEQIRPIITRHEQAASFMACGYAMYTDRLGVCFATAGPGAFNLFSGLAVAMSDSYPVLAISGYASLEWRGQGLAQRDVGPQPHARLASDVRRPRPRVVPAHRHRRHLRRAGGGGQHRLRGAARAGPHPRAREPHPSRRRGRQLSRRPRSTCGRSLPDPARVAAVADGARRRLRRGQEGGGAGRLRRDPQRRRAGDQAPHRALPDPAVTTLDGKGIVSENHPLSSACSATAATSSAWKAFLDADVVLASATRSTSTRRSTTATTCSRQEAHPHQHLRPTRSTRSTRPTTRSSPTPSRRSPR